MPDSSAPLVPILAGGRRLGRFVFVGGTGAVFNLSLLVLLIEVLRWHHLLAAVVTIEVSTFLNYLLNRYWTWEDRRTDHWSFLHYHHATMVGMIIQWLAIALGTGFLSLHYAAAAFGGILAASGWNFLAHHHFTFAHVRPENREARARVALYGLAALVLLVGSALFAHDWDTFVFQRSVEDLLQRGQTPYDVAAAEPDYIFFGIGTPIQPLWYAYPPLPLLAMTATYSPVAAGWFDALWLGRVLIKLPFVASTLGFAFLARRVVASLPRPDAVEKANRLERLLLFNPLFLVIATVWGQFESLLLCFLLLSLLALRTQRWGWAGAAWAAAVLVKIFPLYLGPLWLLHLARTGGQRAVVRFFGAAAALGAAVCLPFFLDQPSGFLQQVLLMHSERPPARFAPLAFLYEVLKFASRQAAGLLPGDAGLGVALSLLGFILTALILGLLALGYLRTPATEGNLVLWSGLSLLGGLLTTKIISEQYMLLPLGLLAIYRFLPEALHPSLTEARLRRLLGALTMGFCAAAILDSVHFVIFVPDEVMRALFAATAPEMVAKLSAFFGISTMEFRIATGLLVAAIVLVPLSLAVRALVPFLLVGFETGAHGVARFLREHPPTSRQLSRTLAVIFVLMLLPPMALGALQPRRDAAVPMANAPDSDGPLVLAHYRTDWFNPTTRPEVQAGTWVGVRLTPSGGYYNSISHKAAQDLALMRLARIAGIVVPLDSTFENFATAAVLVASEMGMAYALEVDLAKVAPESAFIPLTPETSREARELLDGPSFGFWDLPYHLRFTNEDSPALFLKGPQRLRPTFQEEERRHVASLLTRGEVEAILAGGSTSAFLAAPRSQAELDQATPAAAAWRSAYARATQQWWLDAFDFSGPEGGIDLYVDQAGSLQLPNPAKARVRGEYQPVDAEGSPEAVILHVAARPEESERFSSSFEEALAASGMALLLSWNDFDLGLGLEPTLEGGATMLSWLASTRGSATLPASRIQPDPTLGSLSTAAP